MTDWMKNIPSDFLISEINIPGTHDSCTQYINFSYFARCQNLSILEQLNIGIRFLDLRLHQEGNRLLLVHGAVKCYKNSRRSAVLTLDDVLRDCFVFLKENPSETIIVSLKRDSGDSSENAFDAFFENYINIDDPWYLENRVPSLGEVRGKLVLFNRCSVRNGGSHTYDDSNAGLNLSGFVEQGKSDAVGYIASQIPRRDGSDSMKYFQQDMYKLSPKQKWEKAILPTLSKPLGEEGIAVNFFSAAPVSHGPKRTAKYIYKKFEKTKLQPMRKYGWMILDFPTEEICRKIVLSNFQINSYSRDRRVFLPRH